MDVKPKGTLSVSIAFCASKIPTSLLRNGIKAEYALLNAEFQIAIPTNMAMQSVFRINRIGLKASGCL